MKEHLPRLSTFALCAVLTTQLLKVSQPQRFRAFFGSLSLNVKLRFINTPLCQSHDRMLDDRQSLGSPKISRYPCCYFALL
jgi:hypothetical protein